MKNDSGKAYLNETVGQLKLHAAEVEVAKVKFHDGAELGIDFHNIIDAWSKMEFIFTKQIRQLQSGSEKIKPMAKQSRSDLHPLVYSIREKID